MLNCERLYYVDRHEQFLINYNTTEMEWKRLICFADNVCLKYIDMRKGQKPQDMKFWKIINE